MCARATNVSHLTDLALQSGQLYATTGSLTITDHLLDTCDTRFRDVAAFEVMSYRGDVFVIAGSGDDGITLLKLLPDGQRVTRADTAAMTLNNVSAIAVRGNSNGLDIFVTSSSEHGITPPALLRGPQRAGPCRGPKGTDPGPHPRALKSSSTAWATTG